MKCLCYVAVLLFAVTHSAEVLPWWKTAIYYQVYPRSFKDSDGNGVGDLKGIAQNAAHFKDVGVTAIWISPIFKSPMADFGYDISDYRQIDPTYGTMDDFKALVKRLQALGIKLLLDLVPNHTSDEHEWFQKSLKKIDPYTDYYVWQDGKINDTSKQRTPPNNWISVFSGPAWEWSEERQQYYLHQFIAKQPDLNYRNDAVVKELDDIIMFWLDMGVDGFRVDAVPFLIEDEELRDEEPLPGTLGTTFAELDHQYTQNQPLTFTLLRHWAEVIYNYTLKDNKPRVLLLEAYANLSTTVKYYGEGPLDLMMPFNFELLSTNQSSRPSDLRDLIIDWMTAKPAGSTPSWVVGNHDQERVADRYGYEMVDAINLLTGVLPGIKVTYNGEEIGMQDTYIRFDQTVDPAGLLLGPTQYVDGSRDPERTPMQWDDSISAGFSTNSTSWLPVNPNYYWLNVEAQKAADSSHLKVFQAMAQVRQDPVLLYGSLDVEVPNDDTLLVIRKYESSVFVLIVNMGSSVAVYTTDSLFAPHNLDMDLTVVIASDNSDLAAGYTIKKGYVVVSLRPKAALLLKSGLTTSY